MKKILTLLFALLSTVGIYADVLAELTFPGSNDKAVSSYTAEWTATNDYGTWAITGFNNNNNAATWTYIRCGSKSAATTSTITTPEVVGTVSDVTITVDKTSGVTSAKLNVIKGGETVSTTDIANWAAGDVVVSITAESGSAYQLVLENEKVSSNGTTQISKVVVNGVSEGPTVAVEGVVITDKDGNELNYGQFNPCMMIVGESMAIKAAVTPSNASNKKVNWELMQNEEVVSFEGGVVKALASGVAAIVATTEDGEYQALFYVNVSEPTDITVADFIAAEGKTGYITGTVGTIANDKYGNFDLTDETGTIYVYGCLTPEGNKQQFASLGIEEGDIIKVLASEYKLYGETHEAVNVIFVEKLQAPVTATFEVSYSDGIANVTPSDETVTYAVTVCNPAYIEAMQEYGIEVDSPAGVFDYFAEAGLLNEYVYTGAAEFDVRDFAENYLGEEFAGDYTIIVAQCEVGEDEVTRTGDVTTLDIHVDEAAGEADGSSFEKALAIVAGNNSAKVVDLDYGKGAYFVFTAAETTVLSVRGNDGESINFYNADFTSNYDATSSYDASYVATYSIKVAAGETIYVQPRQGYSATGDEVSFIATIATGVLEHGMAAEDPIALEMGKEYWFQGGNAYFTYTAAENGVVVFSQASYCYGASYTVDGNTVSLNWNSSTKEMNMPVEAGKTYSVWTSASEYSIFSVSARFTQPKKGDTMEDPFTMALGENTLPKEAQTYYYSFTNNANKGFLTVKAEGCLMGARSAGYSYNNLADHQEGTLRVLVDMDQEVFVLVERSSEAAEDGVLVAEFTEPAAGDLESNPIQLASSQTDARTVAPGEKFFVIRNTTETLKYLNVIVDTEGISTYGTSSVRVYAKGNSYQWASGISTGEEYKVEIEPAAEYMIYVKNVEAGNIQFRAWLSDIKAGDTYNMPIAAVLGQNTVAEEGQKFYSYTATKECKLSVTVGNSSTTTLFFPNSAYDTNYGRTLLSNKDGEYVLAVQEGETVIFRMTGAAAGDKFVVAEKAYGAGETRATALPMENGVYTLDDLAPYNVWVVYEVEKDGQATITPEGFAPASYYDNVYFAVNSENEFYNNLRGYNETYDLEMQTKTIDVKAGDKLYLHIDVQSYNEGATITVTVDGGTGINAVESQAENAVIYNIAGQRIQKFQKGINIVGGKKVLK